MTDKHTGGPWNSVDHSWRESGVYAGARRLAGLQLDEEIVTIDNEATLTAEMRANARLIAAAPELLAALEAVMKEFGPGTMSDEAFSGAVAALSRARGE